MKQISITIVLALIFICGINQLAKNSEGVQSAKAITSTGFSIPVDNKTDKQIDKFYYYFPSDEVPIILDAAERNGLTPNQRIILFAIRKAENGGENLAFGVMDKRANTFDLQAGWCAATIKKNYQRWEDAGKPDDYITFLGNRYCPVNKEGLSLKENELNKYWIGNVKSWINKLIE